MYIRPVFFTLLTLLVWHPVPVVKNLNPSCRGVTHGAVAGHAGFRPLVGRSASASPLAPIIFPHLAAAPERAVGAADARQAGECAGLWLPGGTNLTRRPAPACGGCWKISSRRNLISKSAPSPTSKPNTVFAIRLATAHAGQWLTNLPCARTADRCRALSTRTRPAGRWKTATGFIELSRVGDWTLVAAGPEANPLSAEISAASGMTEFRLCPPAPTSGSKPILPRRDFSPPSPLGERAG